MNTGSGGGTDLPRSAAVRAELVGEIVATRSCSDHAVLEAMNKVPREAFVPAYFVFTGDGRLRLLRREDDPVAWLDNAYLDTVLVTQMDARYHADDADPDHLPAYGVATCSASQPSLMAGMLALLDLAPGRRVLEIGVGTGYNAALLCELVGADNVTSIEYDPVLAEKAAVRLRALGYEPTVLTGDGGDGVPDLAPFDRVIATCAFDSVPAAWLEQTGPGGVIIVNLMPRIAAGVLATFRVVGPQTAVGRVAPAWTCFMPTRAQAPDRAIELLNNANLETASVRKTNLRWSHLRSSDGLYVLAALTLPVYHVATYDEAGGEEAWLLSDDGSAACQQGGYVVEIGPRALWKELEAVADAWHELGRPRRTGFELLLTLRNGRVRSAVRHPKTGRTITPGTA